MWPGLGHGSYVARAMGMDPGLSCRDSLEAGLEYSLTVSTLISQNMKAI